MTFNWTAFWTVIVICAISLTIAGAFVFLVYAATHLMSPAYGASMVCLFVVLFVGVLAGLFTP